MHTELALRYRRTVPSVAILHVDELPRGNINDNITVLRILSWLSDERREPFELNRNNPRIELTSGPTLDTSSGDNKDSNEDVSRLIN